MQTTVPRYHPTADQIVPGVLVSYRTDHIRGVGAVLGEVDEVRGDTVLVSWPATDMPHSRTDERGRRGQAFTRGGLMLAPDSGPGSWVAFTSWTCGGTMVATDLSHLLSECPEHGARTLAGVRGEWTERGIAKLGVEHQAGA